MLIQDINGVKDIKVEQVAGQPYLMIDIDRKKIARFGINVADVQELITTAIRGRAATQVYEGESRFDPTLRFPEPYRNSVAAIGEIRVESATEALILMSDLAKIDIREGPAGISCEQRVFTSTALTVVVLPTLYSMFAGREVRKEEALEWV